MKIGWLLAALFIALIIPAQAAMNAKMREFVLNPMYSAMINFSVGALLGVIVTSVTVWLGLPGNWRGVTQAPWWAWGGGLVGMTFVTIALLSVPRLGTATFSAVIVAGQLIGALILDHYGWLGVPQNSVTPARLAGALLLLAGVLLMQNTSATQAMK
jgi:bacterial/archaeal transporter family-2 protein